MELLDSVKIEVKQKPIFSIIAIVMPLLFLCSLLYIGVYIAPAEDSGLVEDNLGAFIITVLFFFSGLISCMISLFRRERPAYLKWIGGVINGFFIFAIVLSFIL